MDNFTPQSYLQTAVLFIVFNRPNATSQVFEAIREAKPPRLYIASDGFRKERKGEDKKVAKVREIVTAVDWPCKVKTLFRTNNVGCQLGPRSGIDWFFENEDFGIILEDDCVPSQSFFWFCEELLKRYKNDESIMAITGTNITTQLNFNADFYLSKYFLPWGWASWQRAWKKYDPYIEEWGKLRKKEWLKGLGLGGFPFEITFKKIFNQTYQLKDAATWWDYQWIFSCWKHNGLIIAPSKNLIKNIGFGSDATHTFADDKYKSNLLISEMKFPLKYPENLEVDRNADLFITKNWFQATWVGLAKSIILKLPGAKNLNRIRKKVIRK